MALSSAELKALAWYTQDQGLRPQLSTPPRMYFKDRNGNSVEADIASIVSEHKSWNDQDKKRACP